MQHISEQYPMILFIEKTAHEEIVDNLSDGGFDIIKPSEIKNQYENNIISGSEKNRLFYTTLIITICLMNNFHIQEF